MNNSLKDSELVMLIAVGVLIIVLFAVMLIIMFLIAQRKILNEKMSRQMLEISHREKLLQTNILIQENERRRIAKDLHDDIGSKLNVIHLNLHQLKKFGDGREQFHSIISDIYSLIHLTISTTRRISHDLLPPTLDDFGLVEAVKELFDAFENDDIDFELKVLDNQRTPEQKMAELNIFRVIQELINNSIKHGKPSNIGLTLDVKPQEILVQFIDNGNGFDATNLRKKKGLGLKNIDSRLNMVNASITYISSIGNGVEATVSCPIPLKHQEAIE